MKSKSKTMFYTSMVIGIIFLLTGCKGNNGGTNPGGTDPEQGLPAISTVTAGYITASSAVSGGNITSDGGSAVTERGVCWSTSQTPTVSDNKTTDGTGTGNYVSNITGLTENTTYYVRAYAKNGAGTKYGAAVSFVAKTTYYGYAMPGETPIIFASGILTPLSVWAGCTELSPDGTQFFASVGSATYAGAKLYYSRFINDTRTSFVDAPFTTGFIQSMEPVFSADGTTLTFTGRKSATSYLDLWTVKYTNNTWGVPVAMPSHINSSRNEYRGSYMTDGTFYFGSDRTGTLQIYKASPGAQVAELVSAPINNQIYDCDPCIAKDGHFLIFSSSRAGGAGLLDLYVSFSNGQGGWGTPINLGAGFNSQYDEYGPHLSIDGKYLFFTSHTNNKELTYWVSISAIEKLK